MVPSVPLLPPHRFRPGRRDRSRPALGRSAAFTILEVIVAAIVLVFGLTAAITTLQCGFQAVDTARNYTYAAQLMQTELERLRLQSWDQVQSLQDSGNRTVPVATVPGTASAAFTCTRDIRDLKPDMKEVTLTSTWRGYDGRTHTTSFITRYGRTGLYDYFYTAH